MEIVLVVPEIGNRNKNRDIRSILGPQKRRVRALEGVIRILGWGREKEKEIPVCVGTIDCYHPQGRYPKSEKCSINSFQKSFRSNIHNFFKKYTAWAISIQTVPFEKNHSMNDILYKHLNGLEVLLGSPNEGQLKKKIQSPLLNKAQQGQWCVL